MAVLRDFIICPNCGQKTKTKVHKDTYMKRFPLYCTKCKEETVINVFNQIVERCGG